MPKRTDLKSILIIGAGPIVIGQACEFDYSGAQACKALRQEGYRVILVNSNPATIMTDPDLADATYIEPITPDVVARIIAKEKPDAVLPDHGRADRAQHRDGAAPLGQAEGAGRRADRRQCRSDRHGGGPPAVPQGDGPHRAREPEGQPRLHARRGARHAGRGRPARRHPPQLHARRHRRRHRLQPRGIHPHRRRRHQGLAGRPGAGRGIGARLEGVRDGGGPRPRGQLHHHLLDREHRPDGRAYRRQHHRRAGADADRQGIPADAQRLDRGAARDRRRYRRQQRAVRGRIRRPAA